LQFARQLWVPAHAKRSSWYPVLPPESPARAANQLAVKSLLIDRSGGEEVLLKDPQGTLVHDGMLPAAPDRGPVTGLLADAEDGQAFLLALVSRVAAALPRRVLQLPADSLP